MHVVKGNFICSRIETYIPGMALVLGFNQTSESNPRQEASATIVASSSDSVDVIVKLPKVLQEIFITYILYVELHKSLHCIRCSYSFALMRLFFCVAKSTQSAVRLFQFQSYLRVFLTTMMKQEEDKNKK